MQAITGNHSYIACCCIPYQRNSPAVKAISCFLICQCIIDIVFAIGTFGAFFRLPSNNSNLESTSIWIMFFYILVWAIATLGSIITHFMARSKFSQGGQYKITKTTLVFAMIANCCGAFYYLSMVVLFAFMGFAIGQVDHPAFKGAKAVLIIVAACLTPIVVLFTSQIIAGCKAFTQAHELPGGPRSHVAYGETGLKVSKK